MILSPSHDVQTNVVTRRKTPIAPVSRKHKGQTAIRQVSWLPGQCLSPAFPVSRFAVSPVAFGAKARRLQLREQRRISAGFPIIHALAQTWCVRRGLHCFCTEGKDFSGYGRWRYLVAGLAWALHAPKLRAFGHLPTVFDGETKALI